MARWWHALAEEHAFDDILLVDGKSQGAAHAAVGEEGVFEVIAEVGVAEVEVLVFGPIARPFIARGLAVVLLRGQVQHVEISGFKLEEAGGHIGDDAVDYGFDIGRPVEIARVGFKNETGAGHPFFKPVGSGA